MAPPKKPKQKTPEKPDQEVELVADAWPRFEQFIKQVAKAGPKHRAAIKPKRKSRG